MKNIISCKKKIFLLVKLCFFLHFFSNFIPLDPDPDPLTQMIPDPTGSGSTSLHKTLVSTRATTEVRKHFFSNRVVQVWNALPTEVKEARLLNAFKSKLKEINLTWN